MRSEVRMGLPMSEMAVNRGEEREGRERREKKKKKSTAKSK